MGGGDTFQELTGLVDRFNDGEIRSNEAATALQSLRSKASAEEDDEAVSAIDQVATEIRDGLETDELAAFEQRFGSS
jgi:hypothetical protein